MPLQHRPTNLVPLGEQNELVRIGILGRDETS